MAKRKPIPRSRKPIPRKPAATKIKPKLKPKPKPKPKPKASRKPHTPSPKTRSAIRKAPKRKTVSRVPTAREKKLRATIRRMEQQAKERAKREQERAKREQERAKRDRERMKRSKEIAKQERAEARRTIERERAAAFKRQEARIEKVRAAKERAKALVKKGREKVKAAKQMATEAAATEKKHTPPKQISGKRYRDSRGHFVSYDVWVRDHMLNKFEKEWRPVVEKSMQELAKLYPIDEKHKAKLDKRMQRMAKAMADSNFDLDVYVSDGMVTSEVRWEGAITIAGLPKKEEIIQKDMLTKAFFAALNKVPQKGRRGLMLSFAMLSEDELFLLYARKRPVFENRFFDMSDPKEVRMIVIKMLALFDQMTKASFDVSGLRMMLYFDNSVAHEGMEAVVKAARRAHGKLLDLKDEE